MNVTIEQRVMDEIFSQARKDTSTEVIGLLLGTFNDDEMMITDYLTGPSESSRVHASLSRDFLAKIAQKKIDGKLKGHILGWYHSHPDYGCFMSDRDVATQENIQNLFPDAVALVVDPVRDDVRLYRTTSGNHLEVPFRVKENRQKDRRENGSFQISSASRMHDMNTRKIAVILLILALVASDVSLYYMWKRNSALQEKYNKLEENYKLLYSSVDKVMIITDRFDDSLAEFASLVELSTSEQLRKSFCNFLIIYLGNFKKANTASLENQFAQKNYNMLILEAKGMLRVTPIVFGGENLVTVDIQLKELSRVMLNQTDAQILMRYGSLFSAYLSDFKEIDVSQMKAMQDRGEYRQAIEEGITLNNRRPTVIVNYPQEGEKITGIYKIAWKAFDADGVIESLSIEYRNIFEASWNVLGENIDASAGAYDWDTSSLPDGEYLLRIMVTDDAQEKAMTESGIFSIKHKNTPPTLTLLVPSDNQTVKGSVNIQWSASDTEGDTLKIRFEYSGDGGVTWNILAIVANTGFYVWDVSSLPAGAYVVKVTADDSHGGVTTVQVSIMIVV